jgi:hypothetical protein
MTQVLFLPTVPDLAPSDFHFFVPLKDALLRTPFGEDKPKYSVREEQGPFSKEFYGIQRRKQRWRTCVDNEGDCGKIISTL